MISKRRIIYLLSVFSIMSIGWGCIDGVEVELWSECYNIEETTFLELSNSGLTGNIPSEIGHLINLTYLNLWSNQVTGNIPSEIGNLTNLWYLDLQGNQLTGNIPSEIGNLVNLTILRLNDNNLSGEIPGNICDLTIDWSGVIEIHEIPLLYFDVDNNNLCPPYPVCIEDNMGYQDISNCEEQLLCDEDMYWSDCGLPFYCNPTCLNPEPLPECDDYCEIGCFCNDGYIFSDGAYSECILLEECNLPGNQCIINGEIGFLDCELCCWDTLLLSWLGDGYCDQFGGCGWEGPQFDCPELGYDCGDCDITWNGDDLLGLCFDCPDNIEGDLNFDGYVNILDVVVLVNCIILNDCNSCFDINYDGTIDVIDIVLVVNTILED